MFLLAAELFRLLIQTAPQDLEIGPFGRQFAQSQFVVFTHPQCVSLRLRSADSVHDPSWRVAVASQHVLVLVDSSIMGAAFGFKTTPVVLELDTITLDLPSHWAFIVSSWA